MSSYQAHSYGSIFTNLVEIYQPKQIVEFGILEGYSLRHILAGTKNYYTVKVEAYDMFEEYPFRHADLQKLIQEFGRDIIREGDFYKAYNNFANCEIDFLHIDISNTGETYKFAFEHYLSKVSPRGLMVLEGGSEARDNIEWMVRYNKKPIRPVLENSGLRYITLEPYPSLTIVQKG